MDSLSQAVLGASVGGAVLARPQGPAAQRAGENGGFSHSLLVLLPVSLLLAWLLQRWRPAISLWRWWAFTGLCLLL